MKDRYEKVHDADVLRAAAALKQADHVLIAAGAGLSVAAGIDYTDEKAFARLFPAMVKRGFRYPYQLMGYTDWSVLLKWGYLAANVQHVRFGALHGTVYSELLQLVSDKDYFVTTSNVDALFERNGFDGDRVFTPQGDYAWLQCLTPCSEAIWEFLPILSRILPAIDPATQEVTDPAVIPQCPNCGGEVFMNVRGGDWFVEAPYERQAKRLATWVKATTPGKLVVLELGAGFNTPSVIRWPNERLVSHRHRATLIRVNRDHADVPETIRARSIQLPTDAGHAIGAIREAMFGQPHAH